MTITGGSALPKEDIDRMMKDAELHAEEDKRRREEAEVRNQAESLVYQTEKFLKDNEDKVPAEAKDKVKIRIAYDESGNVLGSEKTVNGQPGKLSDTELKAVKARLGSLRKTADAAKVAAK